MQKNVKFVMSGRCTTPISTIVYFGENEIVDKINKLKEKISVDVLYIKHKGENGKKDHTHVLLRSRSSCFTNIEKIRNEYFSSVAEIDTENYKKGENVPCKPFVQAKSLVDWYYYHLHDFEYLESKGEKREFYNYPESDLKGDKCLLNDIHNMIENKPCKVEQSPLDLIIEGIVQGKSNVEILSNLPVTSDNLYSTVKGLKELRKEIDISAQELDNKFFNDMYIYIVRNCPNIVEFKRLNMALIKGNPSNSDAQFCKVLFETFLKSLSEQDLINMYFQ